MTEFKIEASQQVSAKITPAPTTHVYNLDYDGCLDSEESEDLFIKKMINDCVTNEFCTEIILSLGSLRQFIVTDVYNANFNAEYHDNHFVSCSRLITQFPKKLAKELDNYFGSNNKVKVQRVHMLNSDIYNQLKNGTTLKHMSDNTCKKFLHPEEILPPIKFDITDIDTGEKVSTYNDDMFENWVERFYDQHNHDESEIDAYLKEEWGSSYDAFQNYQTYRNQFSQLFHITEKNERGEPVTLISLNKPGASGIENVNCGNSIHFPDESKIIAFYNLVHFLRKIGKKCFRVYQVDDVKHIIDGLEIACEQCPGLLPESASFQGVDWDFNNENFDHNNLPSRKTFYGKGWGNDNFEQDIREFVIKTITNQEKHFTCNESDRNRLLNGLASFYPKVAEMGLKKDLEQKRKQEIQKAQEEQEAREETDQEDEEDVPKEIRSQCSANYPGAMYPIVPLKKPVPQVATTGFSLTKELN